MDAKRIEGVQQKNISLFKSYLLPIITTVWAYISKPHLTLASFPNPLLARFVIANLA